MTDLNLCMAIWPERCYLLIGIVHQLQEEMWMRQLNTLKTKTWSYGFFQKANGATQTFFISSKKVISSPQSMHKFQFYLFYLVHTPLSWMMNTSYWQMEILMWRHYHINHMNGRINTGWYWSNGKTPECNASSKKIKI